MWKPKTSKGDENEDPTNNDTSLSALRTSTKSRNNKITINGALSSEDVEEEELHITQTDLFKQQSIRNAWKPGSAVEIYSESQAKWNEGKITKIFNDDEGEWLVIKYAGSTKEIQRFNECVRPISSGNNGKKQSNKKPSSSHSKTLKPSQIQKKLADLREIKQIITSSMKQTSTSTSKPKSPTNGVGGITKKNGTDRIPADSPSLSTRKRPSKTNITISNAEPAEITKTKTKTKTKSNVTHETEEKIQENGSKNINGESSNKKTQKKKIIDPWLLPCPHGDLSIDELRNIKLRNRRVCAVRGLPSFATEKLLVMNEWYGQFKGMRKIHIDKNKPKSLHETDSILAFITFDNEKSVQDAIDFSNNATFGDGRKLKAAFGIQYYCRNFLAKKKCEVPFCRYKHEWVKDIKDVITLADMEGFKCMLFLNLHKNRRKLHVLMMTQNMWYSYFVSILLIQLFILFRSL